MRARSVDSGVPTMVNIRSPVSSWGTLAMEIREPESRRISVILAPPRPLGYISIRVMGLWYSNLHDASNHVTGDGDVLCS